MIKRLILLYIYVFDILFEDGLLCEIFMKIPGKLIAPGYAEVVKNPITIPQIQQKTRAGEYPSMEEFTVSIF